MKRFLLVLLTIFCLYAFASFALSEAIPTPARLVPPLPSFVRLTSLPGNEATPATSGTPISSQTPELEETPLSSEHPAATETSEEGEESLSSQRPGEKDTPAVLETPSAEATPSVDATPWTEPSAPPSAEAPTQEETPDSSPSSTLEQTTLPPTELPDAIEATAGATVPVNAKVRVQVGYERQGEVLVYGDTVVLTALLTGFDDVDYTLQWFQSPDQAHWTAVPDATRPVYRFPITEENAGYAWRVQVTIR